MEVKTYGHQLNIFSRTTRVVQIFLLVLGFLRQLAAQRIDSTMSSESKQKELAQWSKQQLIRMGPTFIKLGQIISTRADLVPKIWVEEFSSLQDEVAPFSFEKAKEVIENELGKPIEELFFTIEIEPLKAASLGQIHLVTRLINDRAVTEVIKVQRPGVEELVRQDLSVLRSVVQHLVFFPRFTKEADLYGFLNELEKTFADELNYEVEAANTEEFRLLFADQSREILIPSVDFERSARRVLTLEYLPGTKISQFTGSSEEIQEAARILISAFLKQFVLYGVFHADPHPGNIAVRKDADGTIKIILYDFGMVGRLPDSMRDSILRIAANAFKGDAQGLIAECVNAGILTGRALNDPDVLAVFEKFISKLEKVSAETIGVLQQELFKASESGGVAFPRELTLVGRSLLSLEGDLKAFQKICPELKLSTVILTEATPLAAKLSDEPIDPIERSKHDVEKLRRTVFAALRKGRTFFEQIEKGNLQIPVTDVATAQAVRRLRFGAKGISAAILFGCFFVPALAEIERHPVLGLALLAVSVVFLERWYMAEQRLDS